MAATKVTVLAAVLVSVSGGRIPPIPAGHRAEYNLLLRDGGFKYGFDTGAGQTARVQGDARNEVQGGFSYESPAGPVGVQYTAGVAGFVPSGSLQAAPGGSGVWRQQQPSPGGVLTSWSSGQLAGPTGPVRPHSFSYQSGDAANNLHGSYSFTSKGGGATHMTRYLPGADTVFVAQGAQPALVRPSAGSWEDTSAPAPSGDASYQFGYETGDATRQEVSDAKGNVRGSYSFIGVDGQNHRVAYEAGAGKGFVASGDILPKDGSAGLGAWRGEDEVGVQLQLQQPAWGGQGQGQGELANTQMSQRGDGSYSFSYSTPDQSRQEAGDISGNVQGSYSFVAKDDGQTRRVDYHAGSGTGFVAKGDHLPKPQPDEVQHTIVMDGKIGLADGGTQEVILGSDGEAEQGTGDASYEFSYENKDSNRHEKSDSSGNVKGSFSFVAPDGVNRHVSYEAGAGKGFVAKGAHLPKEGDTGIEAIVKGGLRSGEIDDEQQTQGPLSDDQQSTLQPDDEGQSTQASLSGDAPTGDASFSYAYETDTSRKQESADSAGNVRGSFSYIDASGKTKTVTYTARKGEGFKAEGEHLPKPGHQFLEGAGDVRGGSSSAWTRSGVTPVWGPGVGVQGQGQGHGPAVVEQPVGNGVLRTYLPPHHIKAGYVFEAKTR